MFSEAHFSGILFAPIVAFLVLGIIVFFPVRYLLGRVGFLRWIWHPPLFELSLFICVTAVIVLTCA